MLEANGYRIKLKFTRYDKFMTIAEFRDSKPWIEWNGLTITAVQSPNHKTLVVQNNSREVQVIRLPGVDEKIYKVHPGKQMVLGSFPL